MNRIVFLLISILLFVVIISCDEDKNNIVEPVEEVVDSITWVGTDFIYSDTTIKKPYTLLYIYADWCHWCQKMKDEVFTDFSIINTLHNNFNCVKVNPEIDSSVVYMDSIVTSWYFARVLFRISGYPHLKILDSLNQEVGKFGGYAPPDEILIFLETFTE